MRGALLPEDHAFADGPVFDRVTTLDGAREALAAWDPLIAEQYAPFLMELWRRFDASAVVGEGVKLGLGARLVNLGESDDVRIEGPAAIRGILRAEAGGRIRIGRFVYVGDHALISARKSIDIGDATLLAHGVQIFDNNSHPIQVYQREVQFRRMLGDKGVRVPMEIAAAEVHIGRNCWVGMNSLVMKGVTIGSASIVAAASVITSDVPSGVVVAGNPGRQVRELTESELAASDTREIVSN